LATITSPSIPPRLLGTRVGARPTTRPVLPSRPLGTAPPPRDATVLAAQRIMGAKTAATAPPPATPAPAPDNTYYLPFDAQYEQQLRDLATQQAGYASQQDIATRRLQGDTDVAAQQMAQQRDLNLKALANKLASQGITRSSINVGEQGKLGQQYLQDYGQLQTDTSRNMEDMQGNYANQLYALQQALEGDQYDRVQRAQEGALATARTEAEKLAAQTAARKQQAEADALNKQIQAALRRLKK